MGRDSILRRHHFLLKIIKVLMTKMMAFYSLKPPNRTFQRKKTTHNEFTSIINFSSKRSFKPWALNPNLLLRLPASMFWTRMRRANHLLESTIMVPLLECSYTSRALDRIFRWRFTKWLASPTIRSVLTSLL